MGKFVWNHTVVESEIDELGHANNLCFIRWMLESAFAHSSAVDWPPERFRELGSGWVVRSHHIEYLKPALLGEAIKVVTWVSTMQKATSQREYEILRGETVVARAHTVWAFTDYMKSRPIRIPEDVSRSFEVITSS